MLQDAGTATALGIVSLLLGKDVTLLKGTTALDLTFKDAGKLVLENAVLPVQMVPTNMKPSQTPKSLTKYSL